MEWRTGHILLQKRPAFRPIGGGFFIAAIGTESMGRYGKIWQEGTDGEPSIFLARDQTETSSAHNSNMKKNWPVWRNLSKPKEEATLPKHLPLQHKSEE